MSKSKVLMRNEYHWENSSDIEGDVDWVVGGIVSGAKDGEFTGIIKVIVEYIPEEEQ